MVIQTGYSLVASCHNFFLQIRVVRIAGRAEYETVIIYSCCCRSAYAIDHGYEIIQSGSNKAIAVSPKKVLVPIPSHSWSHSGIVPVPFRYRTCLVPESLALLSDIMSNAPLPLGTRGNSEVGEVPVRRGKLAILSSCCHCCGREQRETPLGGFSHSITPDLLDHNAS